jgi:hypothetical protein
MIFYEMSRVITKGLKRQLKLETPQKLVREGVYTHKNNHVLKSNEYNQL